MPASTPLELEDKTADPLAATGVNVPPPLLSTKTLLGGLMEDIAARHKHHQGGGWTGGLRVGLRVIDHHLRGLRPKSVTILNAAPNVGKSTLLNQIAFQAAALPGSVTAALYVTYENDPTDLLVKQLARLSGWPQNTILGGEVSPDDRKLTEAAYRLAEHPLFYLRGNAATDAGLIMERTQEAIDATDGACRDAFIAIDYMQIYSRFCGAKTNTDNIGIALSEFKEIAQDTGGVLMTISSQSREANKQGGSTMFGGRGSGEIEYDADVLMTLTEEDSAATDRAMGRRLTVVKSRFGGAGQHQDLRFYPEHALYVSPDAE